MSRKQFYSPTDLIRYMDSPFAFWMDRYAVEFPDMASLKDAPDELANVLQKR